MEFYILCLFLFNFIVEFGYVIGQVSEECKIYNTLNNLPDTDCCLQKNVCDGKGYVQFLDLSNSSLTEIPNEVGELVHLKNLYLKDNYIRTVPEFILNLKDLQKIVLSNNNLTEVPEVITKLHNLISLNVDNNSITELTPLIGNAKSLEYLGIFNNQLTSLPKEIGNLPSITNINVMNNNITKVPDEIGKLNTLNTLYLYNNHIETIPSSIGNLKQLKLLDLGNNKYLKSIPPEIFSLENLEIFGINRCPKFDIKVINFPNVVDKCYFYKTNISCYQQGTCKIIKMDDGSNKNNLNFTESEYLESTHTRICTQKEIESVKQGITNTGSSTLMYICIIVGVIVIIIIIVAIIWYTKHSNRKNNKKVENNIYINNSSDIVIYEKPQETPASPESPPSNVTTVSPASDVTSVLPSSNFATVLPVNALTSDSSIPIESSMPFIYCKNAVSDKIEKYLILSMPNNKNEKNEKNEKLLLGKDNNELPPPPYSKD